MPQDKRWTKTAFDTLTPSKRALASASVGVRIDQYEFLIKLFKPTDKTKILDVGVASEEWLPDTNLFEKLYPHKKKMTLATIENAPKLRKIYRESKVVKITPHQKLPFKDNEFDIAVSWATLEHVGDYSDQKEFINEIARVSRKFFLTTPYRGCIYEPHSGIFFIHWLPLFVFRKLCKLIKKDFWADINNLNPLFVRDIAKMKPVRKNFDIKIYKMFRFLPSHLIIYSK